MQAPLPFAGKMQGCSRSGCTRCANITHLVTEIRAAARPMCSCSRSVHPAMPGEHPGRSSAPRVPPALPLPTVGLLVVLFLPPTLAGAVAVVPHPFLSLTGPSRTDRKQQAARATAVRRRHTHASPAKVSARTRRGHIGMVRRCARSLWSSSRTSAAFRLTVIVSSRSRASAHREEACARPTRHQRVRA
jgi:hypothetical protein